MTRYRFNMHRATAQVHARMDRNGFVTGWVFWGSDGVVYRSWMFAAETQDEARMLWRRARSRS